LSDAGGTVPKGLSQMALVRPWISGWQKDFRRLSRGRRVVRVGQVENVVSYHFSAGEKEEMKIRRGEKRKLFARNQKNEKQQRNEEKRVGTFI